MSNTEYRVVIKFFTRKRLSATEITKDLANVYDRSAPSYRAIVRWVTKFKDPTRAFEDVPRSVRPTTALTDESIRVVEGRGRDARDRQVSVRCVADELTISKISLYEIIIGYLEMKKICTRWVPKCLTPL